MQGEQGGPSTVHQGSATTAKELEGLPSLKEVKRLNEGHRNFSDACITSVIRSGRGSEGIMKMLDVNETFGPKS